MKIEKKLNERNYALDFFKIIATILIVWHHYQQSLEIKFNRINFYYGKFYFGYLVELFFAISGFLMFKYIQKIKDGPILGTSPSTKVFLLTSRLHLKFH